MMETIRWKPSCPPTRPSANGATAKPPGSIGRIRAGRRVRASPRAHRARCRQYFLHPSDAQRAAGSLRRSLRGQDRVEEDAGQFDLHVGAPYWHQRSHGQREGRRQSRLGQGEGHPSRLHGDTLYAESTVLHKRESKSRPTQGIVTVSTRGINQDGAEVMSSAHHAHLSPRSLAGRSSQLLISCKTRRHDNGYCLALPIEIDDAQPGGGINSSGSKLSMGMAMAEPPALLKALADHAEAGGIEDLKVFTSRQPKSPVGRSFATS